MNRQTYIRVWLLLLAGLSTGCESISENLISAPSVHLSGVQVLGLGFKSQTFLLSFDIANPNGFALPVRHVGYRVKLDGQLFASGETASNFTVPAGGQERFAISVEVHLLQTAPQLLSIIRAGMRQDIAYQLNGRLNVDIPLVPSIEYSHDGTIRLDANMTNASLLR
jgi:LEA14-like dessication related protein